MAHAPPVIPEIAEIIVPKIGIGDTTAALIPAIFAQFQFDVFSKFVTILSISFMNI
jgi:hypothetical protein